MEPIASIEDSYDNKWDRSVTRYGNKRDKSVTRYENKRGKSVTRYENKWDEALPVKRTSGIKHYPLREQVG